MIKTRKRRRHNISRGSMSFYKYYMRWMYSVILNYFQYSMRLSLDIMKWIFIHIVVYKILIVKLTPLDHMKNQPILLFLLSFTRHNISKFEFVPSTGCIFLHFYKLQAEAMIHKQKSFTHFGSLEYFTQQ